MRFRAYARSWLILILLAFSAFIVPLTFLQNTTVKASPPTWLDGWTYNRQLTIDSSLVDETLTDFPVLVKLDSGFFDFSKAKTNGEDIRFTSADGTTQLKYEIEKWGSAGGEAEIWVKIPSVSSTSDTDFYMYYGNPDASDAQDPTNVWESSFMMVQHLQETSGGHQDSTSNGNDAAVHGATQGVTGKIDGADSFSSVESDYLDCGNDASLTLTQFTLEAWIRRDGDGTTQTTGSGGVSLEPIIAKGRNYQDVPVNTGINVNYFFGTSAAGVLGFDFEDNSNGGNHPLSGVTALTDGQWYHVSVTRGGTVTTIYLNGNVENSATAAFTPDWAKWPATIGTAISDEGGTGTPKGFFLGVVDEVRISSGARSAGWLKAAYHSGADSLLTYGSEEASSLAPPTYSGLSYDTTTAGAECEFQITWDDADGLGECIFGTDNSGSWVYTPVTVSGTTDTAYITITLTDVPGATVHFRWTCEDSYGHLGDTGEQSLVTTSDDWLYRMKLEFGNLDVSENLIDFPVLINLARAGTSFWSHVNPNVDDLKFIDSDETTELYFEVESWNYGSEEGLVWVKVPQIDASSDTDFIYLCYGNPSPPANPFNSPPDVWDSNYVLVMHLSEASGTRYDSTGYSNDGSPGGTPTGTTGFIGGACDFDSTSDVLIAADSASLDYGDVLTLEMWLSIHDVDTNFGGIDKGSQTIYLLGANTNGGGIGHLRLGYSGTGTLVASTAVLPEDSWSYAVGTKNGADARIYINGLLDNQATTGTTGLNNNNDLRIGQRPSFSEGLNSVVDEVRISNVARSAGWIKSQYLSMSDVYVTFSSEELIFVVPEYLLGAIMAMIACFAAYLVFARMKSKQLSLKP